MSTYRGYALKLVLQLKGLEKITRSFELEVGPVRAVGVPAVLLSVAGVVLASGAARALAANGASLAEAVREARALLAGDGSPRTIPDAGRGSVPLKS